MGRRGEYDVLEGLLADVRAGKSRVLVIRGEPGIGKTALLDYLVRHASGCRVIQAAGVQSEMELPFAGLHQLLAPLLGRIERLPTPQRNALLTAFGIGAGPAPERFLVSLAVLSLLSDTAEEQPLICLVDDEQWLDRASAQILAFVARRLEAESVGLVFAARELSDEVAGLPELTIEGLPDGVAHALLDLVLTAPLDVGVRNRIVAETRGNPLALLELPRGLTPAELAGGFGLPSTVALAGRIESEFQRRLDSLAPETRLLVLVAAAEPVGDPVLVWRAAALLGINSEAATPAAEAGLLEIETQVLFRHPMVRTLAYTSATLGTRRKVHRALGEVTDPEIDPDRRAWHRAQAAEGPDGEVADELERSASRAQARGGLAAAAAFLERSAILTLDPDLRAQRLLAAARAKRDAGALDDALGLLISVEAGPPDPSRIAEVELTRGQIALMQRRGKDAGRLLLSAAKRLEPIDAALAGQTRLEALWASIWEGNPQQAAEAASVARPDPDNDPDSQLAVDVLLNAAAIRFTDGYVASAPKLARAVETFLMLEPGINEVGRWPWLAGATTAAEIAVELWDEESAHSLATRIEQYARDAGAPVRLQFTLIIRACAELFRGELSTASHLIDEHRLIAEVTRNPPVAYAELLLAAWQGEEKEVSDLVGSGLRDAGVGALGRLACFATYSSAVLYNGLGRYDAALGAAHEAFGSDQLGIGPLVVPELVEAASRSGEDALVRSVLDWLSDRTRVTPTEWALGIEARARALLSEGEVADSLYRESIERLGRTHVTPQLARAHLLYGEWLRRERRRSEARAQLHTAYDLLSLMGIEAFAERARRELLATGETVRKRSVNTRSELTAREAQIALLARTGLSNPEIATRLFISPRTVQYHLHKVFTKLDITSREQLARVLPGDLNSTESL
jgi:DNA-binding CsgD family transcriptional regulator